VELTIAGYPGFTAGALTETSQIVELLRDRGVSVRLVPLHPVDDRAKSICDDLGCITEPYRIGVFKDRIVASWNNGRFLCHLPEIMDTGKPRLVIWANCMTVAHEIEKLCHARRWIDRFAYISNYQRREIKPGLEKIRPVVEFEGYTPYLNPESRFHSIRFNYLPPGDTFTLGRISRDDPLKFSPETWQTFAAVDTGKMKRRVVILGMGDKMRRSGALEEQAACNRNFGDTEWVNLRSGEIDSGDFYKQVDCVIHQTGGSRESYCRVVVESAAAGVPFIGEREYALPELVIDGVTGFLCHTSLGMADRARQLAADESLRKRIIFQAREHLSKIASDSDKCWEPWGRLFKEVG
jgi:hypothetical protein